MVNIIDIKILTRLVEYAKIDQYPADGQMYSSIWSKCNKVEFNKCDILLSVVWGAVKFLGEVILWSGSWYFCKEKSFFN